MLDLPGGRVIVGVFGAVLIVVGAVILMRRFEKDLRTEEMRPATRRVLAILGIVGGVACGVVATGASLSVLLAAVRYDPSQAKGLDETLRSFAATPAGPVLLIAAAVGLVLFGLYSFCEARWRKAAAHETPAEQCGRVCGLGDTPRCVLARRTRPAAWAVHLCSGGCAARPAVWGPGADGYPAVDVRGLHRRRPGIDAAAGRVHEGASALRPCPLAPCPIRAPSVPFGTVNSGQHGYRRTTGTSREKARFRRSDTL